MGARVVFADVSSMKNSLAQHIRNKTGPLRSLTGNILDNYFVEYGCWCYYGDEHGSFKGRGEPVDQWDTFCKELNQGYECAYMDAQARGDTACEPWNEQFGSLGFGMQVDTVALVCDAMDTKCKKDACLIE